MTETYVWGTNPGRYGHVRELMEEGWAAKEAEYEAAWAEAHAEEAARRAAQVERDYEPELGL